MRASTLVETLPPGGGMFKVDNIINIDRFSSKTNIVKTVRYWDKAGTEGGTGARTAGVKMSVMASGKYVIHDVKKGRWETHQRERIIKSTAEADEADVRVAIEQEGGSGGKESAQATVRNLSGFSVTKDRPTGDKVYRADPFSVQVNEGQVMMIRGEWNTDFLQEMALFPVGVYKDQVDAGSGAFSMLSGKREVRIISK